MLREVMPEPYKYKVQHSVINAYAGICSQAELLISVWKIKKSGENF